jgi:D-alanyl-D-alanine carboxypeptidase
MNTVGRRSNSVLGLVLVLLVTVAPAAEANTGSPPPVRTSSGGIIVRDWLAEHRRYADWHLTLIDPLFMVTSWYAPSDLSWVGNSGIPGRGYVRRFVLADLRALDRAARAAGIRLRVVSAYRSYGTQKSTFNYWVQQSGWATAVRYSARPGHSEHQLGTSLDFGVVGGVDPWNYADFGSTRAGAWLKANAWKYGFVMSYPKGAERLTGYGYEPWHYRYFGRTLAAQQRASGLVPRYWLWKRN